MKGKWRRWGPIGLTGADNDRAASRGLDGPRWDQSSASFASYTTMWPSGDADGLIITKEPASHIAAGTVENEDSPRDQARRKIEYAVRRLTPLGPPRV